MITYKCRICGGQMELGSSGSFVCAYCGSKSFLTDNDFKGNEEFRKKLLQYYKSEAENKEFDYASDRLWTVTGTDVYAMSDGQELRIEYMKKYQGNSYVCYIARETVVYVFDFEKDANSFLSGIKRLVFPAADVKLHRSFPELKMELGLQAGKYALVFVRRVNLYPAEMFAPWGSAHLAWVISRLENICCALEYSGLEHRGIAPEAIWVNPFTHEGVLFGDWRGVRNKTGKTDLIDLRKTAISLADNTADPKELYDFLNNPPGPNAFNDFEKWDGVIEKGFGGHKFTKMKI